MSECDVRGAELARLFHAEVVGPLLAGAFPGLRYAAGRLGSGSDVLGLDDARSRDHDWGCRLTLLIDDPDTGAVPDVGRLLERELPEEFRGFPVRFPVTWDASLSHRVEVATVAGFAVSRLGVDATGPLAALDWLILTGQSVLEVIAGPVFTDKTATLAPLRAALSWLPSDVERYVLAAGWQRVSQQLPFVGRTADRGDDLGSRLLAGQLAGDLMSLAFTLSRRWAPYGKWRGTAFQALPAAGLLSGDLAAAITGQGWRERESALAAVAETLLDMQRDRGLPAPERAVVPFWDRPYRGINPEVAGGLMASIADPDVGRLPPCVGSIEQWVDSVDVLGSAQRRSRLQAAYRAMIGTG
jgi:Domain of unknown function (DUF4037)